MKRKVLVRSLALLGLIAIALGAVLPALTMPY